MLAYYVLQKTEEDKKFFFSHKGYYNFWNEYLICNIYPMGKLYWVIVNRTGRSFSKVKPKEDQRIAFSVMLEQSIRNKIPKEMFIDFPELENIREIICKDGQKENM